jgi:putative membrane protein insertion efficiency factor
MMYNGASMSRSWAVRGAVRFIQVYQFFSRLWPRVCRFHPTCSQFAKEALERHGFFRGVGLALGRVARCHPFHPGGIDPVP